MIEIVISSIRWMAHLWISHATSHGFGGHGGRPIGSWRETSSSGSVARRVAGVDDSGGRCGCSRCRRRSRRCDDWLIIAVVWIAAASAAITAAATSTAGRRMKMMMMMNALLTVRRVHHVDIFLFCFLFVGFFSFNISPKKGTTPQVYRPPERKKLENFCGLFCLFVFFPRWTIDGSWINRPRKKGTKIKMAAVVYFSTVLKTTTALTSHNCTDWRDFWRTENGPFTHRIFNRIKPQNDDDF